MTLTKQGALALEAFAMFVLVGEVAAAAMLLLLPPCMVVVALLRLQGCNACCMLVNVHVWLVVGSRTNLVIQQEKRQLRLMFGVEV